MKNFKTITLIIVLMISVVGCSSLASRTTTYIKFYTKEDYPNPKYDSINEKEQYLSKYYIVDNDKNSVEIPKEDIWKVKDSKKEDLFYFTINKNGEFVKYSKIGFYGFEGKILPVDDCLNNGLCKLYKSYNRRGAEHRPLYVKKSILYQGETILNEREKKDLLLERTIAKPAKAPWITPGTEICKNYGGTFSSYNICNAKLDNARVICEKSGGRLPKIDELEKEIDKCKDLKLGSDVENNKLTRYDSTYISCYQEKGFSYSKKIYLSSTDIPLEKNINLELVRGLFIPEGEVKIITATYSANVLCIK